MQKFNFDVPFTKYHHPRPGACVTTATVNNKWLEGWTEDYHLSDIIFLQIQDRKTLETHKVILRNLFDDIYFVAYNSKYQLNFDEKLGIRYKYLELKRKFNNLTLNEKIISFCGRNLFSDFVYPQLFELDSHEQLKDFLLTIKDNKIKTRYGEFVYLIEKHEGKTIADVFKAKYEELEQFSNY